jgi:glycosyltransferase involved in cell wall biosynthesis
MKNYLVIVTCYGSTPHFSLTKYLEQVRCENYEVFVLPAIKLEKGTIRIEYKKITNGGLIENKVIIKHINIPESLLYFFQYLLHLRFIQKEIKFRKGTYDYGFAEGNFNAALLYFLKKLNVVTKTVFMNGDLIIEKGTSHSYLKSVYGWRSRYYNDVVVYLTKIFRRFAVKNSIVWYPSKAPAVWDIEHKMEPRKSYVLSGPQISEFTDRYRSGIKKNDHFSYLGQLTEITGIYLVIDAISLLKNKYKYFCNLHVIGGSGLEVSKLVDYARSRDVNELIECYGFIEEPEKVHQVISETIAAFAMYKPIAGNISNYDIDNGKLKEYVNSCTPIVLTKETRIFQEKYGQQDFVFFSNYDKCDLAETMLKICNMGASYPQVLDSLCKYSRERDYNHVYRRMFQQELNIA